MASLLLPARSSSASAATPLPVIDLAAAVETSSVGLSLVRVDSGGVVAARVALSELDWLGGQAVSFGISRGLLVVARSVDPDAFRIPAKKSVFLPARLRSRCSIRTGEQVLLATLTEHDLLIIYPQRVVHEMITDYHAELEDRPSPTAAG